MGANQLHERGLVPGPERRDQGLVVAGRPGWLPVDIDAHRLEPEVAQPLEQLVELRDVGPSAQYGRPRAALQRHLREGGAQSVAEPAANDDRALARGWRVHLVHATTVSPDGMSRHHPAGVSPRVSWSEQSEGACLLDGLVAGVDPELAVDAARVWT